MSTTIESQIEKGRRWVSDVWKDAQTWLGERRKSARLALGLMAIGVAALGCVRSSSSEVIPSGTFEAVTPTATYLALNEATVKAVVAAGINTAVSDARTEAAQANPSATQSPSETPSPTATRTPTETPVPDVWNTNQNWTGELPWNNLYSKLPPEKVWVQVMQNERDQFPDRENLGRSDSFLTSLANAWKPAEFHPDPFLESGLGYTNQDMAPGDIYFLLTQSGNPINEFGNYNKTTGNFTAIVTGPAHDRDAMSLVVAVQVLAAEKPELFIKNGNFISLQEAINDPRLQNMLLDIQNQIFGQVQKGFLSLTQSEIDRRQGNDASGQIPEVFRKPNQSVSCDVFRNGGERDEPNQDLREVAYIENGNGTFTEARDTDWVGFFAVYNPKTDKWDVDEFTIRSYEGSDPNQIYSASGEERLPCGLREGSLLTATPTRRVVIQASSVFEQTPVVNITPTPVFTPPSGTPEVTFTPPSATSTPFEVTVTQAPTQPPQPPATEAQVVATPVVNTPEPTSAPVAEPPRTAVPLPTENSNPPTANPDL